MYGLMVPGILENLVTVTLKGKDAIIGKTEEGTKVNGNKIKCMVMAHSRGQTEEIT